MSLSSPHYVSVPSSALDSNKVRRSGRAQLASCPPRVGLTLHSLRHPITYECWSCGQERESAVIAINREHALV